jgi:hypothetical protein
MNHSIQRCVLLVLGLPVLAGCGADQSTGPTADYALSLTPASLTIVQGATGNATVNISRSSFDGAVTLSLAISPASWGMARLHSTSFPHW